MRRDDERKAGDYRELRSCLRRHWSVTMSLWRMMYPLAWIANDLQFYSKYIRMDIRLIHYTRRRCHCWVEQMAGPMLQLRCATCHGHTHGMTAWSNTISRVHAFLLQRAETRPFLLQSSREVLFPLQTPFIKSRTWTYCEPSTPRTVLAIRILTGLFSLWTMANHIANWKYVWWSISAGQTMTYIRPCHVSNSVVIVM